MMNILLVRKKKIIFTVYKIMPTCQVGVLFVKGFSEVWLGIEVVGISDTPYSVVHSSPLGS